MDPASYDWVSESSPVLSTPNCPVCGKFTTRSNVGWICKWCEGDGPFKKQQKTAGLSFKTSNQQNRERNPAGTLRTSKFGMQSDAQKSGCTPYELFSSSKMSFPTVNAMSQPRPVHDAPPENANCSWEVFNDASPSLPPWESENLVSNPAALIFMKPPSPENVGGYISQTLETSLAVKTSSTTATHASSEIDFDSAGQFLQSDQLHHFNLNRLSPFELYNLQPYLLFYADRQEPLLGASFESYSPQTVTISSSPVSIATPESDANIDLLFHKPTSYFNLNSPTGLLPENEGSNWEPRLSPSLKEFLGSEPFSKSSDRSLQAAETNTKTFSYPPNRSQLNTPHEIKPPQPIQLVISISDVMDGQTPLHRPPPTYGITAIYPSTMTTVADNLFANFEPRYTLQDIEDPMLYLLAAEEYLKDFVANRVKKNPIAAAAEPWAEQITKLINNSWIITTILDMAYLACHRKMVAVDFLSSGKTFHLDPLIIAFFGFGRQSELSAFKSLVERIRRRPAISPQGMAFIHCALFFKNDEQIKPMMRKYFLDYTPSNQRHLKIMDFAWELSNSFRNSLVQRRNQGEFEHLRTTNLLFYELVCKL